MIRTTSYNNIVNCSIKYVDLKGEIRDEVLSNKIVQISTIHCYSQESLESPLTIIGILSKRLLIFTKLTSFSSRTSLV